MEAETVLRAISVVATATLFGGMVNFTALFTPLAFKRLPEKTADGFVREIFGPYYLAMAIFAAIAAIAILWSSTGDAIALGLVAMGYLMARYFLMPIAHHWHDARARGEANADAKFQEVHRRGAFLTVAQFVVTLVVLVRFAI